MFSLALNCVLLSMPRNESELMKAPAQTGSATERASYACLSILECSIQRVAS